MHHSQFYSHGAPERGKNERIRWGGGWKGRVEYDVVIDTVQLQRVVRLPVQRVYTAEDKYAAIREYSEQSERPGTLGHSLCL